MATEPRRVGPPVPGETHAERDERERNNRADYVAVVADGGPPYDDEHPRVFDSLPGTDAECPFHDLDPAETVFIRLERIVLPYSAERACVLFHEALVIDGLLEATRRRAGEA